HNAHAPGANAARSTQKKTDNHFRDSIYLTRLNHLKRNILYAIPRQLPFMALGFSRNYFSLSLTQCAR
ncbi:hypothetical protein, partial [Roseimicrobium gellanilyticum]|uniref:hypothetical protein n=1 Tax=Roseimicrobium gellanilyticum TaxID=748857 RepID=UPI001B869A8A